MEKRQVEQVQTFIQNSRIVGTWAGQHRNIFVLQDAADLFRIGQMLLESGYIVEPQAAYARRRKVSRQSVLHWLDRDGNLIGIRFGGWFGRPVTFVVDAQ